MTEVSKGYNLMEFIRGQSDCKKGVPHKQGQSESYDAGYGAEYQLEQINSNSKGQ